MSKKNLLSESQVRQFMKLAKLEPLTPGFVGGLTETTTDANELEETHGRSATGDKDLGYGIDDTSPGRRVRNEGDEELEAQLGATEDELGDEDELADVEGDELDDLGPEEPPAGDERLISVDDFLSALESALEGVMGDEVEIEADEEVTDPDDEDDFAPEGEEVVADIEAGEELQEDEGSKKDEYKRRGKSKEHPEGRRAGDVEGHYKAYEKDESIQGTDELVEHITKRVAARILKSALAVK